MKKHLGLVHEFIARLIPDREAIVWGERVLTHAQLATRSRRLANALRSLGLGCHTERDRLEPWESGHDHVALYLYNCSEYLEGMYGTHKARAAFVNVNYRYKADELVYLFENSAARAVIYHASFAPQLAAIRARLPRLKHFIQVQDESGEPLLPGAIEYEAFLAAHPDTMPALPYSPDDLYILYTGGTTGMPKGVLWRQEDVFYNGLGGALPGFPRLDTEDDVRQMVGFGIGGRALVCLPYMHGAGQWSAYNSFHRGGTIVMPAQTTRFDAHDALRMIEQQQCNLLQIIGDAFARPLIQALRERTYDLSSLQTVASTAAVLTKAVREELLSLLPEGVMTMESIGGSEFGLQGMSADTESGQGGLPAYPLRDNTVLLTADRRGVLTPGSDEIGWIASQGFVALGYLGDGAKTESIFLTIDGTRYCVGGDRARYLADGRALFLGRESVCINTGGEKVFAEEVERVVKTHPAIYDALAVGTPSERWGQQVTAVASLKPGCAPPTLAELRQHCASQLADYKLPKAIVIAPEIVRSPSGKPDYGWAVEFARQEVKHVS